MDVVALLLAILAAVAFAAAARPRVSDLNLVAVGLALLTVALICQFTALTGHPVIVK